MATTTRRRKAAPEPEPTEEAVARGGPSKLAYAQAKWIKRTQGIDITAEQVYWAQQRRAFRDSDEYEEAVAELDEAREKAEAVKAERATRKTAAEAAPEPEEAPAPRKRTGRKPAAAKADPIEEAAQEAAAKPAAKRTRARTTKAATPAAEPAAEAPARRSRSAAGAKRAPAF